MLDFLVGSRKFLLAILFMSVSLFLLISGKIPAEDWLKHMTTVMVAFLGANISEHVIDMGKDWISKLKPENKRGKNAE